jgi:hypothetical protein
VLLSSATFFEGYDTFVLAFALALVLGDLSGSEAVVHRSAASSP